MRTLRSTSRCSGIPTKIKWRHGIASLTCSWYRHPTLSKRKMAWSHVLGEVLVRIHCSHHVSIWSIRLLSSRFRQQAGLIEYSLEVRVMEDRLHLLPLLSHNMSWLEFSALMLQCQSLSITWSLAKKDQVYSLSMKLRRTCGFAWPRTLRCPKKWWSR